MARGIRAASKSSIQVDFRWNGRRCREKLKLAPTPANRKWAERLYGKWMPGADPYAGGKMDNLQ